MNAVAARSGSPWEPHRWSTGALAEHPPPGVLTAQALTELVLGHRQPRDGKPWVVRGARITGRLDLSDAPLQAPLVFLDCWFDEPVVLDRMTGPYLQIAFCRLPTLAANLVHLRHDMTMRSCTFTSGLPLTPLQDPVGDEAAISLEGTSIGGALDLSGTRIISPAAYAVYANSLQVGLRCVMMSGFAAHGTVSMIAARIGGQLRLIGAAIDAGPNPSLNLNGASVGGSLFFNFTRSDGPANADTWLNGAVQLAGAEVRGQIIANRTTFAGDSLAIFAEALHVTSDVHLVGSVIRGMVNIRSARIGGAVNLIKTTVTCAAPNGPALDMSGIRVERGIDAGGATITSPGGEGLVLDSATVHGDVRLNGGFTSSGTVSLVGLSTNGILDMTDATVDADNDWPGLVAVNTRADGGMFLCWTQVEPSAQFDGATTSVLWDDPERWPMQLAITGFTYQRFWKDKESEPSLWDEHRRIAWLARQTPLDTGPYEHLAHVYRTRGQPHRAEAIQVALLRRERAAQTWARRMKGHLWDRLTLYGFRPGRVIGLIIALVVLLTAALSLPEARETMRASGSSGTIYTPNGPLHARETQTTSVDPAAPCGDGDVRCHRPLLYAIDVVVPLVDLGQRSTWKPEPHDSPGNPLEAAIAVSSLLGWILSTLLALSFTKVARTS